MCLARADSENIVVLTFYFLETNFIVKTLQRLVKIETEDSYSFQKETNNK